jgi:hypothetical protein
LHDCYFEKLGYPIVDKSILEEVRVELWKVLTKNV